MRDITYIKNPKKNYITGVDNSPEGINRVFQILVSSDTTLLDQGHVYMNKKKREMVSSETSKPWSRSILIVHVPFAQHLFFSRFFLPSLLS